MGCFFKSNLRFSFKLGFLIIFFCCFLLYRTYTDIYLRLNLPIVQTNHIYKYDLPALYTFLFFEYRLLLATRRYIFGIRNRHRMPSSLYDICSDNDKMALTSTGSPTLLMYRFPFSFSIFFSIFFLFRFVSCIFFWQKWRKKKTETKITQKTDVNGIWGDLC